MLQPGIKGHHEQTVTPAMSAARVGSGLVDVFATPMLVALVEQTCYESVLPHLDEGQGTVGTLVSVSHTSATPIGRREEVRLIPSGERKTESGESVYTLDLSGRPQATYLLTLTTADGHQHTVRLLKQSDIFGT